MFDLTAGTLDRPFRDPHASATAASVAAHIALLGGIAWAVLSSVSDKLPNVPSIVAFVAEAPAPSLPPPPPPPPPARKAKAAEVPKPVPTDGAALAVPADIPVGIQPESSVDLGDEGGEIGGVDGGIEGGVLGGVLGGMIDEAPPPPPPPPPPPAPASSKPRRVGGALQEPALVHRVEPTYPSVAVAGNVSGSVVLEATVNEDGAVTDVKVLRSILLLDKAAIKAVKQWRYQPLVLNGQAVPFILVVTVSFSLR